MVYSVPFGYAAVVTNGNKAADGLIPSSKRGARFKMIGVKLLLAGMIGACTIYWMGTRSPNLKDDLAMVGYDKAESHQMAQLYGNMGLMIDDLLDDLKRPGCKP